MRKSGARSVSGEMALHARASSASENVVSLKDRGSSSIKVYFAIEEKCEGTLRNHISGEGVRDDELFWRWSSQLARDGRRELGERAAATPPLSPGRRLGDEQQSPSENERQKRNLDHLKRRSTHA